MYSRIIIPLDGSELAEQVLPYVRAFAKKLDIPVRLLRVYSPPLAEESDPAHGRYLHRMEAAL